ncbi:MAG: FG-GAP-like repeat-containing protein [Nitrospirota bacterium]|nr:FG-GAP-like repeat-containing protein [Nitrospirota bacterium]
MGKRLMLLALAVTAIGMAAMGCSSNSSGVSGPSVNLVGSKQGQAVGFADVDGDGIEDKIVGAPYAASPSATGAALVYTGTTSSGYGTTNSALLQGGDDNFGWAFVNMGDVDGDGIADFAISAIHGSGDDPADTSLSGTVTIYKGGGNGRIIKKIGGDGPMDKFGYALAAGDVNGDGKPDLVVSAPFNTNDPNFYQKGAVYGYFAPDFASRIALYSSTSNSTLGLGVAAGDVNGDGVADLLMSSSGKVLVYFGGANFAPAIDSPDIALTSSASGFGKAIAVIGDLDGDGKREIAIGAPNAMINTYRDTGSVYIVKGSAAGAVSLNAPSASLVVRIDGAGLFSRFGASVTALGDVDNDGKPDFAVGAPMTDVTTSSGQNILSGKVYLFKGKDIASTTTIANATEFEGLVKNQQFGTSLAKSASGSLLIGAPRSNMDTGGVMMVDPATGQTVAGGSSGGATGGTGDCH